MGDNIFCFFQHLALRDPQGSFSNCSGKVVDLNAVKLVDGDLDRVQGPFAPGHLTGDLVSVPAFVQNDPLFNDLVFQPPQGDIALGEEVAGAAGGV